LEKNYQKTAGRDFFDSHCRCSIVTKSLSPALSEILGPKHIGVKTLTPQGHHDVIGHVTIGSAMCHFLLVVLCTQVSISNGFQDIAPQISCAHWYNALLRMRDITWNVPPM